jgi:3-oxoacyl-[acyl-carrier protein] reductase
VAAEITATGASAIPVTVDVTDAEGVASAVAAAVAEYGTIDILSNTAGLFDGYQGALDTSRETWDRVVAVNLTSLYVMANAVLPVMIAQGRGVIVNMASGAGLRGGGGGAAYTSTKHAVVGFTRQLAADYGKHGVRVNAIAPGLIDTPMTADFSSSPDAVQMVTQQPAGRIGRPDDIAKAALFLVSDDSDFIHAVTLPVDGGLVETF